MPIDLQGVTIAGGLDLRRLGTVSKPFRCTACTFDGSLLATDVVFERIVDVSGAVVRGDVDLRGAVFDDAALLKRAEIGTAEAPAVMDARLARFAGPVNFDYASLSGDADFTGARFLAGASFAGTDFGERARFDLATFAEGAVFTGAAASDPVPLDETACAGRVGASPSSQGAGCPCSTRSRSISADASPRVSGNSSPALSHSTPASA